MESLFRKNLPVEQPPTPHELIEPEIVHLKKGYSIRHGAKHPNKRPPWLTILACGGLAWLYLMDPVIHAWYKGEGIRTYLYLHNYGTGTLSTELATSGLFTPDEIQTLDRRQGSFQDYYASPQAANDQAEAIVNYTAHVRDLHAGKYQGLDPVGRMRYLLFIRTGLVLPTDWSVLDPSIN